jgi:hypothetical protein
MVVSSKFVSYRGINRADLLSAMYEALIDCAKYNRKFYEDFMNAKVLDVGHYNGSVVFKVQIKDNMEIYSSIMRQIEKRVKGARVIIVE